MLRLSVITLTLYGALGCTQNSASPDSSPMVYAESDTSIELDLAHQSSVADTQVLDIASSAMTDADLDVELSGDVTLPEFNDIGTRPSLDSSTDSGGGTTQTDSTVSPPRRESRGQCAVNDDCGSVSDRNLSCSRLLPGGACVGCGQDDECPSEAECSAFGACITPCQLDAQCPAGTTCLSSGRCGAQRCNESVCPDSRFDSSDSSQCQRRPCTVDSDCHASMFCLDDLCVNEGWR